jgi:hypothetical protein
MSVTFNENCNHTIIVEDVESDEEKGDVFFYEKDIDLVKEKDQNQILSPSPQYRNISSQSQPRSKQPPKNKISYDALFIKN